MFGLWRNRHGRCNGCAPVLKNPGRRAFKVCRSIPSGKRSKGHEYSEYACTSRGTGDNGNVLLPISENGEMDYLRRRADEIRQSEKVKSTLENSRRIKKED